MKTSDNASIASIPKWKLVLAGLGVVYLVAFLFWGVYAYATSETQRGASELAANPERQDQILARRRAEDVRAGLGLSDEQTDQLAALIEKQTLKARAVRAESAGNMELQRERMMALREEAQQDIDALLTPEQREKLEALPMHERMRIFGRGAFGGPPPGMAPGGPRPEGGPGWGDGPRGPRPEGGAGWGNRPRGMRPEGGPGWGDGPRGPRPEGGPPRDGRGRGRQEDSAPVADQ